MDYAACNVVYVDRAAGEDRSYKKGEQLFTSETKLSDLSLESEDVRKRARRRLHQNVETLLKTFSHVYVCTSGRACIEKVTQLTTVVPESSDITPTLLLIDVPEDDVIDNSAEIRSEQAVSPPPEQIQIAKDPADTELYGSRLLQHVVSATTEQRLSCLVIPVVILSLPEPGSKNRTTISYEAKKALNTLEAKLFTNHDDHNTTATISIPIETQLAVPYIDLGAVDVIANPICAERLPSLAIHIYRAFKQFVANRQQLDQLKRVRKRSWVGLGESKPYAYLREAMVSGLMDGICRLNSDTFATPPIRIEVPDERRKAIWAAVGSWSFCAHDFNDDELIIGAKMMLEHALQMEELIEYRIGSDSLINFLSSCRAAYNSFVPYHNFRHVIDVLQATFFFLLRLGTLPPHSQSPDYDEQNSLDDGPLSPEAKPPIPSLLTAFDALTLLITAIGHDVGHPGVNNAFLVTLNAPLAQLYNDRSVLESFHCAAYSQILRRHWGKVFGDAEMRALMISCILATDMGLHFDYMKKLGWLQEKLHETAMAGGGAEGWNGRTRMEYRTLACSLLIKCADISNVARKFPTALRWTMILTDEFSRQANMETDLGIPTALFAPPVRETIELGQSQIGFLNIFAYPLFQGVVDVMPGMSFAIDELMRNKGEWEGRIKAEQERSMERAASKRGRKDSEDEGGRRQHGIDGFLSPRQQSLASEKGTSSSGTQSNLRNEEKADDSDAADAGNTRSTNLSVAGSKHGTAPATPSALRQNTPAPPQEAPYESSTIPSGNPSMEDLEQRATPPLDTVGGKMQLTVQNDARAVLEFPRPDSKAGRPVTAPPASGAKGSDGAADSTSIPQIHTGNGHAISNTGNNANGKPSHPSPSRPTHQRQRPSTSSTPMASRPVSDDLSHAPSSGSKPAPNGCGRGSGIKSASASLMVPGTEGKRERDSIVTTIRTLARKPSRRFRWWKKKEKEQAEEEDDEGPKPGVRVLSPEGRGL